MSDVILLGEDGYDLVDRLKAAGLEVTTLTGFPTGADLDDAGVEDAEVVLVADVHLASLIPVARERQPTIQVIVYSTDRLPPFASAQADLAVDPTLIDPDELVAALLDRIAAVG